MKKTTLTLLAGTFVAGGLLTGCASAPEAEMTQAQEALSAAETAEAHLYVADLYVPAQDSFMAAQAEIEVQNAASLFSRDYDRAEALLAFVTETATTAATQVEERKTAMRAETETLIAQAEQALAQAQTLLRKEPRSRAIALVSLTEGANSARQMLDDAVAAFQQDDVATAHQYAQSALDRANALIAELNPSAAAQNS